MRANKILINQKNDFAKQIIASARDCEVFVLYLFAKQTRI